MFARTFSSLFHFVWNARKSFLSVIKPWLKTCSALRIWGKQALHMFPAFFHLLIRGSHDVENEPQHDNTGGLYQYLLSNPPKAIDQNSIPTKNLEPDQMLKSLTFSWPWNSRPFFKFSYDSAQLKYMMQPPTADYFTAYWLCNDQSDLDHHNTRLTSLLHLSDSPLNHLRSFLTKLCHLEEKPLIPQGTCNSKLLM